MGSHHIWSENRCCGYLVPIRRARSENTRKIGIFGGVFLGYIYILESSGVYNLMM